eukprot:scaffold113717_cov36-Phaeocystis_antarctica.AAC.1
MCRASRGTTRSPKFCRRGRVGAESTRRSCCSWPWRLAGVRAGWLTGRITCGSRSGYRTGRSRSQRAEKEGG